MRKSMTAVGMIGLGAAISCGEPSAPPDIVTVVFEVRGTVAAAGGGGQPISGAIVKLGAGGHFTMPAIWDTDTTDASGTYELSFTHEYDRNGNYFVPPCAPWVAASAQGYHSTGMEDSRYRVACTSSPQTIRIALDPVE